ncbi:MAG: CRISPR-associated helicase Cas3', partial [Bradymonadaceae bacterium]
MEGKPTGFWAKLELSEDGDVEAWHPLTAHSLDVAQTFSTLVRESVLDRRLGELLQGEPLTEVQVARLSALAALHDAGKVNHGFQNRADDEPGDRAGHVQPLVDFMKAGPDAQAMMREPLGLGDMFGWFGDDEEAFVQMLLATFGHHGRPVAPKPGFRRALWEADDRRDPLDALADLRERVEEWFPAAFEGEAPPLTAAPRFQHAYNGVLTLADWLASDRTFFEFRDEGEDRTESAPDSAARACRTLGLNPTPTRRAAGDDPPGFDAFPFIDQPHEIQRATADLEVHPEGSLTILESDTGSGKTEAAVARFFRLFHAGEVDGMYFALPTRSAATELHGRVQDAVRRAFDDPPPVVQAVPGYIRAGDAEATRLPDFDVRWDDEPDAERRARRWAAEQSKRYLAGTVAVGTIDQVYLSTLRASHAHLRSGALLRHLLVVDEVHASDAYMTRLLESVLDQQLAAGGHAFLMSATLGSAARTRFATGEADPPSVDEAAGADYPLLTHVSADRTDPREHHAASSDYSKEVRVTDEPVADEPESVAERAVEAAQQGARVLVIRNTVAGCRETQRAVEAVAPDELLFSVGGVPAPHHSRFAPDDRERLDDRIEAVFGGDPDETRTGSGVVAVATQTVEQSLDLDADLLLTDLAPVDVLLQRIGRLHRHDDRPRPECFETARTVVLVPDERDLGGSIQSGGHASADHGVGSVYPDLRALEACWRLVEDEDVWTIPEMNRRLVEEGTHPDRLAAIADERGEAWSNHEETLLGERLADRFKGDRWMIDFEKPFADAKNEFKGYGELEEQVKTRLGADDYQVEFDEPVVDRLDRGRAGRG